MSSAEEENDGEQLSSQALKKRRVQRACDICRRKKVRCDGGQMPGHRCSNCVTYNFECTYIEAAKKRGPPKGYVESLEIRLQKMESLLNKLCPDADFSQELGGTFEKDTWFPDKSSNALGSSSTAVAPQAPNVDAEDLPPSDDEILSQRTLTHNLKQMHINPAHMRFFGKSSSIMFIQTAIEAKHEFTGTEMPKKEDRTRVPLLRSKRPQFWGIHPWINQTLQPEYPHQNFPPDDLMSALIELYFRNVNDYMPLLHRPTLEKGIADGLHLSEEGFGSTVLLVCAVGSRFSDDPRVFLEGSDSTHSSGWEWFRQVQLVRKSLLAAPRLYDLQICCLTAVFLQGTSAPQACWTVIGVGIRLAQDVGAHRRKVYNTISTVDEELWKRAFWVLVSMDRVMSMMLGRPCAIQDEDFDLELPTECDDEYWVIENNAVSFKQPPGQPSTITFFNCFLRLNQILAFALRTIYSINKSKALLGFVGPQWEQHIVAELDSALNKWIDSVPDHLRWDPNRESMLYLSQSAYLYSHYYYLQIAVHRPFIPSPRKPSPLSFPSLAICTNAARSCTHVLDVPFRRGSTILFANQMVLFTCGIVLLLNIWGGKRSGMTTDPAKEMEDVYKCMKMLKSLEPRWHTAGRLWDVLYELASVGDLPLPQPSPAPSNKRERDSDTTLSAGSSPAASTTLSPSSPPVTAEGPRHIAGSKRVARDNFAHQQHQHTHAPTQGYPTTPSSSTQSPDTSMTSTSGNYGLPLYTEELGRVPLHSFCDIQNWQSDPMMSIPTTSQTTPTTATAAAAAAVGLDLTAASVFAMPPTMYEQAVPSTSCGVGPSSHQTDYTNFMGGMAPLAGGSGGSSGQVGHLDPAAAPFPDSDTLAMWSNAPAGFEWDDWGSYITSVSGMGGNVEGPR